MDYCLALQKPKKVREIERVILTCYFDEERGKKIIQGGIVITWRKYRNSHARIACLYLADILGLFLGAYLPSDSDAKAYNVASLSLFSTDLLFTAIFNKVLYFLSRSDATTCRGYLRRQPEVNSALLDIETLGRTGNST